MTDIINFLTSEYERGMSYSSLNCARSALSALGIRIEQFMAGTHPLVVRFLRGVFNLRPPVPHNSKIWDVDQVLKYLRKLSPVKHLSLKDLTLKLTMLLCLVNAARVQTVYKLLFIDLQKLKSCFVLKLDGSIKQTRPGHLLSHVTLRAYPPDRRLCIYFVLKEYLKRTKLLRNKQEKKLLISYVKPHAAVTKDTVARWVKVIMIRSGINVGVFGAHSVRAAVCSKASQKCVPISDIMKKAGWTQESTFTRFYKKDIMKDGEQTFSNAVLKI
ncbi:MAG: tyrosine-type recombinase/integrase [Sedimenticola sp.]